MTLLLSHNPDIANANNMLISICSQTRQSQQSSGLRHRYLRFIALSPVFPFISLLSSPFFICFYNKFWIPHVSRVGSPDIEICLRRIFYHVLSPKFQFGLTAIGDSYDITINAVRSMFVTILTSLTVLASFS